MALTRIKLPERRAELEKGIGTIGLFIWPIEKQNAIVISDIKKASSACALGLRVLDVLLGVDSLPVDAFMVKEVVEKFKGPLGSTIQLTVLRKTQTVVVVRDVPLVVDAKGGAKGDEGEQSARTDAPDCVKERVGQQQGLALEVQA